MRSNHLIAAVALIAAAAHSQQQPAITFTNAAFTVTGINPPQSEPRGGWGTLFLVYAASAKTNLGNTPPLAGSYTAEPTRLIFHPRFPPAPGVRYHAVFKTASGALVTRDFDGPPRDTTPSTRVLQIYPTSDVLPANQLRIFIVFSEPMSRGEAAAHLRLETAQGLNLPDELLPGQELWDPDFRRLTMTFDPGRIKRGLTSNSSIGPPITEGKHYRLVLDRAWPDARGVPLVEGLTKSFTGGPPIRIAPDPAQWRIVPPPRSTTVPVTIDFPNPMNFALLQRLIEVRRGTSVVKGHIGLANKERQWRFTPSEPWQPGDYRLVVDTALEDIAGNRIGQLFDIDIFDKVTKSLDRRTAELRFQIR